MQTDAAMGCVAAGDKAGKSLLGDDAPALWYEALAALPPLKDAGAAPQLSPEEVEERRAAAEQAMQDEAAAFEANLGGCLVGVACSSNSGRPACSSSTACVSQHTGLAQTFSRSAAKAHAAPVSMSVERVLPAVMLMLGVDGSQRICKYSGHVSACMKLPVLCGA